LKKSPLDGWLPISVEASSAIIFDPLTGASGKALTRINDGKTEVYLQLKPGQSLILKTFQHKDVEIADWRYLKSTGKIFVLQNDWQLRFVESYPAVNEQFRLTSPVSWTTLPNDTLRANMGTGCYSTTFHFRKSKGKEYVLNLGDVRESARVRLNGQDVATLFSVPFEVAVGKYLKNGKNTLEIEVTNLPANRIADYDRRKVPWRIFHDINIVNVYYKPDTYAHWNPVPSGLLTAPAIHEMVPYK